MSRCFLFGVIHAICVSKSFWAVSAIALYMQSWWFQSWRNSEVSYVSCNRVAYTIDVFCVSKSFWVVSAIALYMQSWEVPVLEEF
jgi:hypothetical protein